MYSSFQLAKNYIRYYLSARNGKGHGMHSPFVFDFIRHVLNDNGSYRPPAALEQLRNTLGKDSDWVDVEDFGAGSRRKGTSRKQISEIARTALKPKKIRGVALPPVPALPASDDSGTGHFPGTDHRLSFDGESAFPHYYRGRKRGDRPESYE